MKVVILYHLSKLDPDLRHLRHMAPLVGNDFWLLHWNLFKTWPSAQCSAKAGYISYRIFWQLWIRTQLNLAHYITKLVLIISYVDEKLHS